MFATPLLTLCLAGIRSGLITFAAADETPPIYPSFDFINFERGLRSCRPPADPNANTVFIENYLDRISWLTYPPVYLVYSVSPSAPPERLSTDPAFPSGLALFFSFCRYHSGLSPDDRLCFTISSRRSLSFSSAPTGDMTLGGSARYFVSFTVFSFGYLGYRVGLPDFDLVFSILKVRIIN